MANTSESFDYSLVAQYDQARAQEHADLLALLDHLLAEVARLKALVERIP